MNTSENIAYLKYFGLDITFWKMLNRLFCGSTSNLAWKIHDINNEKIEEYLKKTCPCTYEKLKKGEYDEPKTLEDTYINPNVKPNDVIWTMWWQGEENAPFLVKECINSMRLHGNGHQVVVLSKNNYKEYVRIPKYIEDRFHESENDNSALKKTVLGNTHLSDIIRTQLLYLYGGIWADATMMFSGSLEENAFFKDIWCTLGQDNEWYIGKGQWSTFFMGCHAGNGFCKFNHDMLVEYWEFQKYYINYLMMDHIFDIAYRERPCFHKMVENVKCGNQKCLIVNRKYNQKCNIDEADEFFKAQILHKLSWKWGNIDKSDLCTEDGKDTWLGYLLKNYKR